MTQAALRLFETTQALRPYQEEALAAIMGYIQRGGKRACLVLATGGGKTRCFSQLPRMVDGRVLVLAHREELLDQAKGALLEANPDLSVEIEQADRKAARGTEVVVASVPTLSGNRRRLDALPPDEFGAVVVDEAHHLPAKSYLTVLSHFGLVPDVSDLSDAQLSKREMAGKIKKRFTDFRPDRVAPFLLGVTATPSRSDGRGLEYVLDDLVYQKSMQDLIELGFLVPPRGIKVTTGTDISQVATRAGDFADDKLANAVDTAGRNALILKAYREHAADRKAILFAASVEHAAKMAQIFREAGIPAASIFGNTPKDERRNVMAAFRRGDVRVMTNFSVLGEGVDIPDCSAIIMARPTKSQLVYTQQLGRGTRLAPGKKDLLVIDMVDVAKVGVVTVNTLFGLPPKLDLSQVDAVTAAKRMAEIAENIPLEHLQEAVTLKDVKAAAEAFDPLRAARPEPFLDMRLTWVKTPYGYAISLGDRGTVGLVVNALGHAEARYKPGSGQTRTLGYCHSLQEAIDRAERWVTGNFKGIEPLLSAGAKWHRDPPSPGQLRRMYALKIKQLPAERELYSAYVAAAKAIGIEVPSLTPQMIRAAQERLGSYGGRSKGEISTLFNALQQRDAFVPPEEA